MDSTKLAIDGTVVTPIWTTKKSVAAGSLFDKIADIGRGWLDTFAGQQLPIVTDPPLCLPEPMGEPGPIVDGKQLMLYPFQVIGRDFLVNHSGAFLMDKPGMGKTIQVICAAKEFDGPVLVICRSINKEYWTKMIDLWDTEAGGGPAKIGHVTLGKAGRPDTPEDAKRVRRWFKNNTRGYVLIHHEALRYAWEDLAGLGEWSIIIADEAHRFNHRSRKQTQALHKILAIRKWALSGTPYNKNPADLWSNLNWFDKNTFRSYWMFEEKHTRWDSTYSGSRKCDGCRNPRLLAAEIAPYAIGRTKEEVVGQFPPITYEEVTVELSPAQRILYDKLKRDTFVAIDTVDAPDEFTFIANALKRFTMLQQCALHPMLVGSDADSSKLAWLVDFADPEDIGDTQFVVFTRSRKFCLAVPLMIPGGACIVGGQKDDERKDILHKFNRGDLRYLVGTVQAMGESVNLEAASIAIFMDPHPSSIVMSQAEQRVHRLSSKNPVLIYRLIAPKTVDENALASLKGAWSDKQLCESFLRDIRS